MMLEQAVWWIDVGDASEDVGHQPLFEFAIASDLIPTQRDRHLPQLILIANNGSARGLCSRSSRRKLGLVDILLFLENNDVERVSSFFVDDSNGRGAPDGVKSALQPFKAAGRIISPGLEYGPAHLGIGDQLSVQPVDMAATQRLFIVNAEVVVDCIHHLVPQKCRIDQRDLGGIRYRQLDRWRGRRCHQR